MPGPLWWVLPATQQQSSALQALPGHLLSGHCLSAPHGCWTEPAVAYSQGLPRWAWARSPGSAWCLDPE